MTVSTICHVLQPQCGSGGLLDEGKWVPLLPRYLVPLNNGSRDFHSRQSHGRSGQWGLLCSFLVGIFHVSRPWLNTAAPDRGPPSPMLAMFTCVPAMKRAEGSMLVSVLMSGPRNPRPLPAHELPACCLLPTAHCPLPTVHCPPSPYLPSLPTLPTYLPRYCLLPAPQSGGDHSTPRESTKYRMDVQSPGSLRLNHAPPVQYLPDLHRMSSTYCRHRVWKGCMEGIKRN